MFVLVGGDERGMREPKRQDMQRDGGRGRNKAGRPVEMIMVERSVRQ